MQLWRVLYTAKSYYSAWQKSPLQRKQLFIKHSCAVLNNALARGDLTSPGQGIVGITHREAVLNNCPCGPHCIREITVKIPNCRRNCTGVKHCNAVAQGIRCRERGPLRGQRDPPQGAKGPYSNGN